MNESKEILLVHKPAGITSYDVIRRLKKLYPGAKMGHAGTLDPRASGLLIVGINDGTKKIRDFLGLDKSYDAEILLGVSTTTDDLEGEVLEQVSECALSTSSIQDTLASFIGRPEIAVPLYSAVKVKGKPLYKYAREGEVVEVPIKPMSVYDATNISVANAGVKVVDNVVTGIQANGTYQLVKVTFEVGSGTYIRSLARELGVRLGVPATLAGLVRTRIGKYHLNEAMDLDNIESDGAGKK